MHMPSFAANSPIDPTTALHLGRAATDPTASTSRLPRWFAGPAAVPPAEVASAQLWRLFAIDAQESGDMARALQCWREVGQHAPDALDAMFHVACCHALDEPGRASLIFDALAHDPAAPGGVRLRCAKLAELLESAAN